LIVVRSIRALLPCLRVVRVDYETRDGTCDSGSSGVTTFYNPSSEDCLDMCRSYLVLTHPKRIELLLARLGRSLFGDLLQTRLCNRSVESIKSRSKQHHVAMATMKDSNHVKVVMESGKAAFGCWQMAPGSNVSRTLARTGVDFVVVDCERMSPCFSNSNQISNIFISTEKCRRRQSQTPK
jgi:hypothetical protein